MLSAVQFDDEPGFDTREIGNVRTDGMLTAEAMGMDLLVAQCPLQQMLSIRHIAAQRSGAGSG